MNRSGKQTMESNRVTTASLLIVVIFIIGVIVKLAKPVLFPFFLAIFLSFILFPVLDFLTKFKIPRSVAIISILLITFFILFLMGNLFFSSVQTFTENKAIYAYVAKLNNSLNSFVEWIKETFSFLPINWDSLNWPDQLDMTKMTNFLLSTLGSGLSFLLNLFLILVFLIFILAGRGQTESKVLKAFQKKQAKRFLEIKNNIDTQVQRYLGIKTVISFVTGFLATIVLVIFGVDFAIVIGFFTFVLNYIPNV
jgi:AI-2 transport protein TqsA